MSLIYLEDPTTRSAAATVVAIRRRTNGVAVELSRTPAYPGGGGQPSDIGVIQGARGGRLRFDRVERAERGRALHLGHEDGELAVGEAAMATIDWEVRHRNARLHTAGELICAAVDRLGHRWRMAAASHFPGQARVAFAAGAALPDPVAFGAQLAHALRGLIYEDAPIVCAFAASPAELSAMCPSEEGKVFAEWPVRMVSPTPGFWRPCLGAHCVRAGEVGDVSIRKLRLSRGEVSVSYTVPGA